MTTQQQRKIEDAATMKRITLEYIDKEIKFHGDRRPELTAKLQALRPRIEAFVNDLAWASLRSDDCSGQTLVEILLGNKQPRGSKVDPQPYFVALFNQA